MEKRLILVGGGRVGGCEDMYTLKQKQDIQLGKTVLLGFGVEIDFYMWKGS